MAITSAALQTALGTDPGNPRILKHLDDADTTLQKWLVGGGIAYPGRVRLIATTASDNAATQKAAVLAALLV